MFDSTSQSFFKLAVVCLSPLCLSPPCLSPPCLPLACCSTGDQETERLLPPSESSEVLPSVEKLVRAKGCKTALNALLTNRSKDGLVPVWDFDPPPSLDDFRRAVDKYKLTGINLNDFYTGATWKVLLSELESNPELLCFYLQALARNVLYTLNESKLQTLLDKEPIYFTPETMKFASTINASKTRARVCYPLMVYELIKNMAAMGGISDTELPNFRLENGMTVDDVLATVGYELERCLISDFQIFADYWKYLDQWMCEDAAEDRDYGSIIENAIAYKKKKLKCTFGVSSRRLSNSGSVKSQPASSDRGSTSASSDRGSVNSQSSLLPLSGGAVNLQSPLDYIIGFIRDKSTFKVGPLGLAEFQVFIDEFDLLPYEKNNFKSNFAKPHVKDMWSEVRLDGRLSIGKRSKIFNRLCLQLTARDALAHFATQDWSLLRSHNLSLTRRVSCSLRRNGSIMKDRCKQWFKKNLSPKPVPKEEQERLYVLTSAIQLAYNELNDTKDKYELILPVIQYEMLLLLVAMAGLDASQFAMISTTVLPCHCSISNDIRSNLLIEEFSTAWKNVLNVSDMETEPLLKEIQKTIETEVLKVTAAWQPNALQHLLKAAQLEHLWTAGGAAPLRRHSIAGGAAPLRRHSIAGGAAPLRRHSKAEGASPQPQHRHSIATASPQHKEQHHSSSSTPHQQGTTPAIGVTVEST